MLIKVAMEKLILQEFATISFVFLICCTGVDAIGGGSYVEGKKDTSKEKIYRLNILSSALHDLRTRTDKLQVSSAMTFLGLRSWEKYHEICTFCCNIHAAI